MQDNTSTDPEADRSTECDVLLDRLYGLVDVLLKCLPAIWDSGPFQFLDVQDELQSENG